MHGRLTTQQSQVSSKKHSGGAHSATALRIGEPDDVFEREADRMAEEIMAGGRLERHWSISSIGIGAPLQRKCGCGGASPASGECEECKKKEAEGKVLQRKDLSGETQPAVAPPIVHEVLNSPGQPLDRATRDYFEPRFGADLGSVRLHSDGHAVESARAVQARAYTVGQHIVLPSQHYSPPTGESRRLLAHELAHTLQQRAVLSRQSENVPDRPLPPHDPRPKFAPTGACYGSAICKNLITPSKLLAEVEQSPVNKAKSERRRQLCQKRPPDPACTADGHGRAAVETATLLHSYDPNRPVPGVKILVDMDLPDEFGAETFLCRNFMPPVLGTKDCIRVPDQMEREAAQFNNTMDPTIGGEERGKWRERTLEKLVHESEHTRFRAAGRRGEFQSILSGCATDNTVSAMNELSAMLTEFVLRMDRIRNSVGLSAEDREKEMEEWRAHRILGTQQSITVSLRTVRCDCSCEEADKMIREAVEFTTASWSQPDKNDLHRELRDPRWKDLDLRWPFVAPALPSVGPPPGRG